MSSVVGKLFVITAGSRRERERERERERVPERRASHRRKPGGIEAVDFEVHNWLGNSKVEGVRKFHYFVQKTHFEINRSYNSRPQAQTQ